MEKSSIVESLEKSLKDRSDENDMLQNRLNVSRNRVKLLETELKTAKDLNENIAKSLEEKYENRTKELEISNEKLDVERNELKVLLRQRQVEIEELQKKYEESLESKVNVNLFHDDDSSKEAEARINLLIQEVAIKQQTINELSGVIEQMNRDKETSENQYQTYATHLTKEMEALKQKTNELIVENEGLGKREEELLQHINALERQIQQQIQIKNHSENEKKIDDNSAVEIQQLSTQIVEMSNLNTNLKTQIANLETEKSQLYQNLTLKDEQINQLQAQNSTADYGNLMKDLEDKSTAASRALSQNQELKSQLQEMQNVFITMTNDKVDLMTRMQTEEHLCKEMKLQYDAMDYELKEMKNKWQFKENEMIRLSHENTELEKKIIQQNLELDRLRHYESKETHVTSGIFEQELDTYKHMVETLTNKIKILESNENHHDHEHHNHNHHHHENHNHHHENEKCDEEKSKELMKEIDLLKMEKNELIKVINDFKMKKTNVDEITENGENVDDIPKDISTKTTSQVPSMATEEALEKLQSRFRRTMLEVAELTEEKQRLEHVVMQLQFETETIGEYITLYQNQRRLLKRKEHERDVELRKLTEERELMSGKLTYLNKLIEEFVLKQQNGSDQEILKQNKNSENLNRQETAGKILEVLDEIKKSNSLTCDHNGSGIGVENVSCCYGRIETV